MERPNNKPPRGKPSSIDRVVPPPTIQEIVRQAQSSLHRAAPDQQRTTVTGTTTSVPPRRSQRIAQRESREGNQASPFLALPIEVRERILHYACDGISMRFRHVNMTIGAVYGGLSTDILGTDEWDDLWEGYWAVGCMIQHYFKRRMTAGLPTWMLLDRQMLSESLRQFHRQAKFFPMNDWDHPLWQKSNSLGHVRLDYATVVDLTKFDVCYLNTWEEEDDNGKRYYIFGLQPDDEAIFRQATYLLASSSALRGLTITFCYGVRNYHDFDLSIHDIRSGIIFFDQLPRGLQKVTFVLGQCRSPDFQMSQPGFERTNDAVKKELRRMAKLLVSAPGEKYEEAVICADHRIDPDQCCGNDEVDWRIMATSSAYRRARNL